MKALNIQEREIFSIQAVQYLYLVSSGSQICIKHLGVKCVLDLQMLKEYFHKGASCNDVITQNVGPGQGLHKSDVVLCSLATILLTEVRTLCSFAKGKKIASEVSKGARPTLQIV